MSAITVDILTGFLGAGKTSLLRRLIAGGFLSDAALLVNEFAETAVDLRLLDLEGAYSQPFASGCLCCAVDGDLREGLLDLLGRRAAGSVPAFERIVVETSGMADPAALLATISNDLRLRHRLRPGCTVTVVDAVNFAATLASEEVALSQIAMADRIILSKCDIASSEMRASVVSLVRDMNPLAVISDVSASQWDADPWKDVPFPKADKNRMLAVEALGTRHGKVSALNLKRWLPVEWPSLAVWLSAVMHRHGGEILRVKGFAEIPNGGPVTIQGVRHMIFSPEHLPASFECAGLELVLIMRRLDPVAVRKSFDVFVEDAHVRPALTAAPNSQLTENSVLTELA